jgi:hypothetical protein
MQCSKLGAADDAARSLGDGAEQFVHLGLALTHRRHREIALG